MCDLAELSYIFSVLHEAKNSEEHSENVLHNA